MRRKIPSCCVLMIMGILAAYRFGATTATVIFMLTCITVIYILLKGDIKRIVILFFVIGFLLMFQAMKIPLPDEKEDLRISGIVISETDKGEDGKDIVLQVDNRERLLISAKEESDITTGMRVTVRGNLYLPPSRRNPGCFDYRLYLRGKKICACMKAKEMNTVKVERPIMNRLANFRRGFEDGIDANMGNEKKEFLCAILFGDRSGLSDDIYDKFKMTGTAHVLATSGLHVGMVYALIVTIIGKRRSRRPVGTVITACLLLCYMVLAGCSISVMRAVIMIGLHIFANLTNRRYDILSAAALTAMIMLAYEPYMIFETGFQMSFLAVLVIAFSFPLIERLRMPEMIKILVMPSLFIQIGMSLYQAYTFNYFAPIAFIANIPIVFLAGLLVPSGVVLMMTMSIIPAVLSPGSIILDILASMMLKCTSFFYGDGMHAFDVTSPPLPCVLLFYAAGFLVTSEWFCIQIKRHETKLILKGTAMIAFCITACWQSFDNPFLQCGCIFLDVGQGASMHVRMAKGFDVLIDGGGKTAFGSKNDKRQNDYDIGEKVLKPYLLKNGVRMVNLAIVSHLDQDHYGGIVSLCHLGMVKKLAVHECLRGDLEKIAMETGMDRKDIMFLRSGQTVKGKVATIKIIAPLSGDATVGNSKNEASLVSRIQMRHVSILQTGDIDEGVERELAASDNNGWLDVDVLMVPHHGSRYSSSKDLIDATSPRCAVVQVGKNNYGHPAPEILKRYEAAGVRTYRNDLVGAVGVFDSLHEGIPVLYSMTADGIRK